MIILNKAIEEGGKRVREEQASAESKSLTGDMEKKLKLEQNLWWRIWKTGKLVMKRKGKRSEKRP